MKVGPLEMLQPGKFQCCSLRVINSPLELARFSNNPFYMFEMCASEIGTLKARREVRSEFNSAIQRF